MDVDRTLLTQVSRFDPWKDPLGVIDAYRAVKADRPDVQLALVGSMAHDDPEGWDYQPDGRLRAGDPDVYILSNLNNIGSVEVNAFQVVSAAVIQKSIREGFGLTVTEALWKTRPMVASRVGGIVAQVQDGETGWLVDPSSPESAPAPVSRSSATRRPRGSGRCGARSTSAGTSSCRGSCATGSSPSTSSPATTPPAPRWRPSAPRPEPPILRARFGRWH